MGDRYSLLITRYSSLITQMGKYQVFFRTSRGGSGIEYETAKAEFLNVFGEQRVEVTRDISVRMRMEITVAELSAEEISRGAELLGYTQGIVSVHEEPYDGEELNWRKTERWAVGWIRNTSPRLFFGSLCFESAYHAATYYSLKRMLSSRASGGWVFRAWSGTPILALFPILQIR